MALPAEKEIIPTPFYKHFIGIDQASSLTDMNDAAAYDCLNIEGEESGRLSSRPGCAQFLTARLSSSVLKIFDYQKTDGTQKILAWNGTRVDDITTGTASAVLTGISTGGLVPGVTVNNDTLVWGDGTNPNKKYDGTNVWALSVPAATAYPTLNTASAGSITTTVGQKYVVTFYNSTTGEEGNPYSVDDLTTAPTSGIIASKKVVVTKPATPSSDPQISHWRIYKTADAGGTFFKHAEVAIATTTYDDNTLDPTTSTELEIDNDEAPLSEHWAEFQGSLFCVPTTDLTTLRRSKIGNNSSFPIDKESFVGVNDNDVIVGLKNKNNLLWIMKKFSTWVLSQHPDDGGIPVKVADRGAVHKYAFDGADQNVLSFASNASIYKYSPTEFALTEIRYNYRANNVQRILSDVNKEELSLVRCVNYIAKTKNQIFFAVPYGAGVDKITRVLVYDNGLAGLTERNESWWPFRFMFDLTSMDLARVDGEDVILFGDEDGNVFKYPEDDGDGAQENGTSTGSNTTTTLNDTTQSWATNELKGLYITITNGTSVLSERKILSNTATQVTISDPWDVTPDTTSEYTIGGYTKEYYSNWKNYGLESLRKVFRFLRVVARQTGNYTVDVIFKRDFDQGGGTIVNPLNISASSAEWGAVVWGTFLWGQSSVARNKIKFSGKFNSVQIGFRNKIAGQDFSIEGFTTHHQNAFLGTKQ